MKFDIKNYKQQMPKDYDGYYVHARNDLTFFWCKSYVFGKMMEIPMSNGVIWSVPIIDDNRRPVELLFDDVVIDLEYVILPYRRVSSKRKKTNSKNA